MLVPVLYSVGVKFLFKIICNMIKNARFFQISLVLLNIKFEKDIVRRKRRGVELEVVQFYEYIVNIRINIETH